MEDTERNRKGPVSQISDVRHVPLDVLAFEDGEQLRRIVPVAETSRVPVAAFNASL